MISVSDALAAVLALARPLETELTALRHATGRVLATDAIATRDQPPFAASAMDGYGITDDDWSPGTRMQVIGEAAAGHGFAGEITKGQAIRAFTGAPLPGSVTRVVIQEDVHRDGDWITLSDGLDTSRYMRPKGGDFRVGDTLTAPRRLTPSDIALLASMNCASVVTYRLPEVAIVATGDELMMPGETPGPDQIIASNALGIAAMVEAHGATARVLPIAKDTVDSLRTVLTMAQSADVVITIGGASAGDHDLVAQVAADMGLERSFYKVAMRPGKPLMAGRLGDAAMVGLPGNPVSSMVCSSIFILPLLDALQGLPAGPRPRLSHPLAHDLGANGPREHYMRATLQEDGTVVVADKQDSSLLTILSTSNCLVVRAPGAPALTSGHMVDVIGL